MNNPRGGIFSLLSTPNLNPNPFESCFFKTKGAPPATLFPSAIANFLATICVIASHDHMYQPSTFRRNLQYTDTGVISSILCLLDCMLLGCCLMSACQSSEVNSRHYTGL